MISLQYQVRETMEYRLDVVEEGVEDLVQGRVGIEVSYHGLEERQFRHRGMIESLRDELPEIRTRAETTQNAQQGQAQELLLVQERLTALESRETARQAHVERLEGIIARMSREIRRLGGAPGDA
jgi:chromosome segregation ATPase